MTLTRRDALSRMAALAAAAGAPGLVRAQAAKPRKLKLVSTDAYTQQPIAFGVEKGFFREQGLEVEFVDVQDAVTGVATGELSYAFGPTSVYLRAAALGAPVKIVASGFRSKGPYFLIARPGINTIADLKGKTVGNAQAGSNLDTVVRTILRRNGLDPRRDVTLFANGATQQAYGSLISGQVDATIIHQPFAALGELEKTSKTLARGWDYLPTYHTGVLIAGDQLIARDPELLRAGLRAYFKSYTYAKQHYPEYLPWLQARLKLNPRAVELALKQEDDVWDNNPDVDLVAIQDTQKVEIEQQNQKGYYDAPKYIDLRFIPREYVKPFEYGNNAVLKG